MLSERCRGIYGNPVRCGKPDGHDGDCGPGNIAAKVVPIDGRYEARIIIHSEASMVDTGRALTTKLLEIGFPKVWIKKIMPSGEVLILDPEENAGG